MHRQYTVDNTLHRRRWIPSDYSGFLPMPTPMTPVFPPAGLSSPHTPRTSPGTRVALTCKRLQSADAHTDALRRSGTRTYTHTRSQTITYAHRDAHRRAQMRTNADIRSQDAPRRSLTLECAHRRTQTLPDAGDAHIRSPRCSHTYDPRSIQPHMARDVP